jgi:hypothetical protein
LFHIWSSIYLGFCVLLRSQHQSNLRLQFSYSASNSSLEAIMQIRQDAYGMGYTGYPAQDTAGWNGIYGQGGAGALGGAGGFGRSTGSMLGQNIVQTAFAVGNGGWAFTGDALARLNGRSNTWEQSNMGGLAYLQLKPGVRPSDAMTEIFTSPNNFSFDCSTGIAVVLLKAQLDSIGPQAFDSIHSRAPMVLAGWTDTSGAEFFMGHSGRSVREGEIMLNGQSTKQGELSPFNAAMGDRLQPGGVYYFERPGDTTTYNQGWNAIYLGGSGNNHQFWRVEDGAHWVDLRQQNNLLIDVGGKYRDEYLSSSVMTPLF